MKASEIRLPEAFMVSWFVVPRTEMGMDRIERAFVTLAALSFVGVVFGAFALLRF